MTFIPVTSITDCSVALPAKMLVGQEYELTATVNPSSATNQQIIWEVSSEFANLRLAGVKTYITPKKKGNFTVKAWIINGILEA